MIQFDKDMIDDLVTTYLYDDIEGRNEDVHSYVEYLWEQLDLMSCYYYHGEIRKVLKTFETCEPIDEDDEPPKKKAVKGVKSEDVAFIATHYGLLYGLVTAENARLHFWEWKIMT